MTPDIPRLPDNYKVKEDELETEDTQFVCYARWRRFIDPVGFVRRGKRILWVEKDDIRLYRAKYEFDRIGEDLISHSNMMGRLKSMCRRAMQEEK